MTRARTRTTLGTIFVAALVILALVACGDTPAPTSTPTQASEIPTALVEEPTSEPTRATNDSWRTFTSEAGGFSIDMPGEPQASDQTTDSPLGQITFYFFQAVDGPAQYVVSYNDYPVTAEELDPEQVLSDALEGGAQGNEVQNAQATEVQGYLAKEGEIAIQGTTHVWYRAILVKNRLYQLIMSAPEAGKDDSAGNAHRSIQSFKLLNP